MQVNSWGLERQQPVSFVSSAVSVHMECQGYRLQVPINYTYLKDVIRDDDLAGFHLSPNVKNRPVSERATLMHQSRD